MGPSTLSTSTASPADPTGHLFASIPKLANDGGNFMLWKYRVREILEARNLLDYVTGSKKEPSANAENHADWVTKNCKVSGQHCCQGHKQKKRRK